jgi:hypothetical protein
MIKATAQGKDGRTIMVLGLSFANLDRLRANPGDDYMKVKGADVGLPEVDIVLFAGETEAHLAETLRSLISAQTKVTTSDRLKH